MSLNMPPPPPAAPMVAGLRDIWVGRLGTPEAGAPVLAPAVREGTNHSPVNNKVHTNNHSPINKVRMNNLSPANKVCMNNHSPANKVHMNNHVLTC